MVKKDKNTLTDLRLRWYSLGRSLSDGVTLDNLHNEIKSTIKDTTSFIKKARFVYDS